MKNEEIRQEQERMDAVMVTIIEQINKFEGETDRWQTEVNDRRKHFWDEVKVNMETFDDYLETIINLRQQAQVLAVNESTHRQASKRLSTLRRMEEKPYFGRIDFKEEGTSPEKIYIGISSLLDANGEDFLIYDWRAPISSIFYDYQPGRAEYSTPEGRVNGHLEKKWQYITRGGVILSMFDTSLTIGDEILQQVLGKNADKQMHSIVATIQQEQNQVIRHTKGRLLIVQGAAGSGKTSVALQRIAYLLYSYRARLTANQVVLFSPNSMFSSYVSNVLPELGEENVEQVTFQEYLYHRLGNDFEVEGPYEQLEYVLTRMDEPSYQTRAAGIRFKASIKFVEIIKKYRTLLESSGMLFKGISFRGKKLITRQQITERFYTHDTTLQFHNRLEKLAEWLTGQIDEIETSERTNPWVEEEIELLSEEEYQEAYRYLREKSGYNNESDDEYEMEREKLARFIIRKKFKPIKKKIKAFVFLDIKGVYRQLFSDPKKLNTWLNEVEPSDWEEMCLWTVNMLDNGNLHYEDATPFLLLNELIHGYKKNTAIKHVLIDEAQDYSPFQFEFLKGLFPSAKLTVLGDFNQAIYGHAYDTMGFRSISDLYERDETTMINLKRSYRSTRPIVEFTRSLVPGGEEIETFDRDGEKPILTVVRDQFELQSRLISKISELQQREFRTIAVICKSVAESLLAYKSLKSIEGIKLMKASSLDYEQGVVVIPVYLAKGIEFDAVLMYNASDEIYSGEYVRKLFYTACTRAMHYLQMYSVGDPCSFVQDVSPEYLSRTF
ncbi:MAG: RNA polymerase recycling motor HelD [Anaerobacillus sp.]